MKKVVLLSSALVLLVACGKTSGTVPIAAQKTPVQSEESFESVLVRAKNGDNNAQFEVGTMLQTGEGVAKDAAQGLEWLKKSAVQGNEKAQFNLGALYYVGEGVQKNYDTAREWFEKAAAKKDPRSQFNLGVMYYRGEGVAMNYPQAIEYFSEAGAQGFNEAQFNLGVIYAKGEGVAQDIGKAYAWFDAAREYGNPRAIDVIKQIESNLPAEQLAQAKELSKQLKEMIQNNIASIKSTAAANQ